MQKAVSCLQIWAGNINNLCFWNVHQLEAETNQIF